jgi:hypothetical protein
MMANIRSGFRKVTPMQLFDGIGLAIALACGLLAVRVMSGV